jgi:hypothetical protein
MKTITVKGYKPLTPRQVQGRLRSARAKGRREIAGRPYFLAGTDTKAVVEKAAKTRRAVGQSCRIFKNTTHYGDWELWVSRVSK